MVKPRFSIVIPCYNEAGFIENSLECLRAQDFEGNYEIIVVDNNCTDESPLIAKRFGAKVVRQTIPGVCQARQKGTLAAKGEIVISTDADMVFPADWLSKIDKTFKQSSEIVAVTGPCRYVDGPWWGRMLPRVFLFGPTSIVYKLTKHAIYGAAANFAFKKDAWAGYDTTLTQGGDELDLLRKLHSKGRVIYDGSIVNYTSSRRFSKGFISYMAVSFFYYYLLGYFLNRVFKRQVIGMAPAYRKEEDLLGPSRWRKTIDNLQDNLFIARFRISFGGSDKLEDEPENS